MFCRNCGQPIRSDSKFCSFCGRPVSGDYVEKPQAVNREDTYGGTGIAAMVCGILGVVFFWTVIPGIVLGAVALALGLGIQKQAGVRGKGQAIAGVVLGIVALALSALVIALIAWGFSMIPDFTDMPVYSM
jgi:hypothetical protein